MSRSFLRCLALGGLSLWCGCGSAPPSVTGVVTLDDRPLLGARILFLPLGATKGHGGDGVTDASGAFEVTAFYSDNPKCLPPGRYKVVVTRMMRPDGSPAPPGIMTFDSDARETLPAVYSDPRRTTLVAFIGAENEPIRLRLHSVKK